jgi:HD-like signal output (HDOD) protein
MADALTPEALVGEVSSLFTLPDLVVRALGVMDSPKASAQDLVEVIELDAGLAAMVLKLANSAMYGHMGRVDTLGRAVALIGHKALRDLVLATSAVRTFKDIPAEFVDMDTFWDSSITCGVLARLIARYARLTEVETLFLGGLLHGVGRLVFYARRPAQYREVIALTQTQGLRLHLAERAVFGFDFTAVGAALMQAWHLPERLVATLRDQHAETPPPGLEKEVAAIRLACAMTEHLAPCLKSQEPGEDFKPDEEIAPTLTTLGLSPAALAEINMEALAASLEVIEIMHPGASIIF